MWPVAGAEAYLHAKFHVDPFSRLVTLHQRHRQTIDKRSPKNRVAEEARVDVKARTADVNQGLDLD